MLRWLSGISDEQPTEEEQWKARRMITKQMDLVNETQAEVTKK
jgi:hypothetical protein